MTETIKTPAAVIEAHLRETLWSMDSPFSNQSDAYYQGGEDALTALAAAGYTINPPTQTPPALSHVVHDLVRQRTLRMHHELFAEPDLPG